jgi:hypothetical protein
MHSFLAIIPIIIFLGASAIYYHSKYIDYKKTVRYFIHRDKIIKNILSDNKLNNDEKIVMIDREYDNIPF